jgi:hypothetical protein
MEEGWAPQSCLPAPILGQRTDAILQELWFSQADTTPLREHKAAHERQEARCPLHGYGHLWVLTGQ